MAPINGNKDNECVFKNVCEVHIVAETISLSLVIQIDLFNYNKYFF